MTEIFERRSDKESASRQLETLLQTALAGFQNEPGCRSYAVLRTRKTLADFCPMKRGMTNWLSKRT